MPGNRAIKDTIPRSSVHLVHHHMLSNTISPEAGMIQTTNLLSFYPTGSGDESDINQGARSHLVVDWPEVNIRFKRLSGDTTRKHVLSSITEPVLDKDARHIFDLGGASAVTAPPGIPKDGLTLDPPKAVPYWSLPASTPA